ncbi:HAD-IA family hydrolase [Sedimenticola selenatireducens]|uniref:HAD-IA family hydrolase n=1 Tax=Sedimenticola selenatireducens TaxID=191960 RepID=UPI002AAB4DC5|nr:HAD-IA family hydrolase [Sedimenticola selenatireducens]
MPLTFAFDVYGTLIDTAGITQSLNRLVGDQASLFSSRWRDKQLEYSFRRGLMRDYVDFSVCTRQALKYTSAQLELPISDAAAQTLLDEYRRLPAFPDVPTALEQLKSAGHRLYAFSNGLPDDLEALLDSAGIRHAFIDIISVMRSAPSSRIRRFIAISWPEAVPQPTTAAWSPATRSIYWAGWQSPCARHGSGAAVPIILTPGTGNRT